MIDAPAKSAGDIPRELRPWVDADDPPRFTTRPSVWAILLESLGGLLLLGLFATLIAIVLAAMGRLGVLGPKLLGGVLLAAALRLLWQSVVVSARRYALTRRYVLRVFGVFARSAATVPVARVQHVVLHRTLLERLTGTGTLGFATAGTGGIEIAWVTIDRPLARLEEVRRMIETCRLQRPEPVVIGLAGGVGSGKSEVARAFAELGCPVADSDKAAREALDRPDVRAKLVEWWGGEVLDRDGRIDRKRVAAIVFADADQRLRLEGLVHPIVRQGRAELRDQARQAGAPAVIVDAPLLFEAGLDAECDAVIFVDAPLALRQDHVRISRGWDQAELVRREKVQLPLDEKRKRSDHEIVNDADPARLRAEVRRILDQILACRRGNGPEPLGPIAG
ncbi:MAG: dephospho-CoA kinase [Phycisphaerales bacterium]|nr:dephospho-CoA kinase [Phycisphaerales bacterium]